MSQILNPRPGMRLKRALTAPPAEPPAPKAKKKRQAWVVTELLWTHNDEYNYYEDGYKLLGDETKAGPLVFFALADAEAHCKRMNASFYDQYPTPAIYEMDFSDVFCSDEEWPENEDGTEKSDEEITWDEVIEAGWQEPFTVVELNPPKET